MTARRRLLILLLLGFVFFLSLVRLGVFFAGELLAKSLTGFFERETTVGHVTLHAWPPSAEIHGLRVAGPRPDSPPFLEVARVVAVPSLAQAWERRIALRELRLESPRVRINAFKEGGDDLPPLGRGNASGAAIRLDRLVVQGGLILLDHERVPVEVDLPDFQGRLDVRRDRALAGRLAFGPGSLRFGDAPALEVSSEMALVLVGRRLVLESGRIHAAKMDLKAQGEVRFGAPTRGEVALAGPVDLGVLDRHVVRTGLGLTGDATIDATVRLEGAKVEIAGHAEGKDGTFDTLAIPAYAGDFAWDGNGLRLAALSVETLGGTAKLEVDVPSAAAHGPVRLEGHVEGVDAERIVAVVFGWGLPGVGAGATGDLKLAWPHGRPREVTGTAQIELASRADERTPLSGRFSWSAQAGDQRIETAQLRTPSLEARFDGRISREDLTDLRLDAESTDLVAADGLVRRLRLALGTVEAEVVGLAGSGVFRGHWGGSLKAPVFEGRFTGRELGWRGVSWGEASAAGSLSVNALEARSLLLRRGESTLFVDGRFETGELGVDDGMEGRVRLVSWPAADLARAFDLSLPVDGSLTGEITLRGSRGAPEGEAALEVGAGRALGRAFTSARAKGRWSPTSTQVVEAQVLLGGGQVRFKGSLSHDGIYDGVAQVAGVELPALLRDPSSLPLFGRLFGEVTLQGPTSRPRFSGRMRSPRLFVGDEGLGAVEAHLEGHGDGLVSLNATCRSARVDLSLEGHVAAQSPYLAELALSVRDTSLDPFVRTVFPPLPPALGLRTTGEVRIHGPLSVPRELSAEVTLHQLDVLAPDYPGRAPAPVRARFAGGVLTVEDFRVAAEGTDVSLRGRADILGAGQLDFQASGAADLRGLIAVSPRLRGFGAAQLDVALTGTWAAPRVFGSLRLDGAGVRVRGFPHGLEDLTGVVRFTEGGAALEGVKGTLAGGRLDLQGQLAFTSGRLASFDLRSQGEGLALRWPEGLRSLVDADLRFFGDENRRFATGALDVRQAVYTRRYDVASEILATRGAEESGAGADEGLNLDILLRVPGTLRIDNNLASLYARADLRVRGTSGAPVLLGHAEVERGRLYFQGRTYVIRHGTLDFVNPARIDPLFDIEAETRVQSYRVSLQVGGTLERVTPTLTSDPPLSALQILNLLAGVDETTVAAMTSTRSNEAQLAASGAATLAAGRISEEVGLERGAERLLGLDRFSIDPALLRGSGQTPTARVTLGKRITPDLSVVYAQDLSGTGERLVSIEYILSDRFSILLTQSESEGFGFDVRLRRSH